MHRLFNETITKGVFPDNLKLADVTPVFKEDDPFDKKNYRPVSVLLTIYLKFVKNWCKDK